MPSRTSRTLRMKKNALQSKLSSLKANKTDTEAYLGELDNELQAVLGEVDKANADLSATESELEVTQQNLAEAREKGSGTIRSAENSY